MQNNSINNCEILRTCVTVVAFTKINAVHSLAEGIPSTIGLITMNIWLHEHTAVNTLNTLLLGMGIVKVLTVLLLLSILLIDPVL